MKRTDTQVPPLMVVGGGLAGMSAAMRLAESGRCVLLVEASDHLGGKAGATFVDGRYCEHGLHICPAWYVNFRGLLKECDIEKRLVDFQRIHRLRRSRFPEFESLVAPTNKWFLPRNLLASGYGTWAENLLLLYAFLDLATTSETSDTALDWLSVSDFIEQQSYGCESLIESADALIRMLLPTRSSRLSAFTCRKLIRLWMAHNSPLCSVFCGNMQDELITPIERRLTHLGCTILKDARVVGMEIEQQRIVRIKCVQSGVATELSVAGAVVAVPIESVLSTLGEDVAGLVPQLAGVNALRTSAMGTLTLELSAPVPGLPREHVLLVGSRHWLSVLDVTETWRVHDRQILVFSVGDVSQLLRLPDDRAVILLLNEIKQYIPGCSATTVTRYHFHRNEDAPLLMNCAGSWASRPEPGPTPIHNLALAGDYCRSPVGVPSMESAVLSGLIAAQVFLRPGERNDEAREYCDPSFRILAPLVRGLRPLARLLASRHTRRRTFRAAQHSDLGSDSNSEA